MCSASASTVASPRAKKWVRLAQTCAYRCQLQAMDCQPWVDPPLYAREAAELSQRLKRADLSKYEPDPIGALGRVEAAKLRTAREVSPMRPSFLNRARRFHPRRHRRAGQI
jgi:hypothetical protein